MIFTFYSYKGGVGRSMALANVAELFYKVGYKVLMVDWDLEAPGLERFFPNPKEVLDRLGIINRGWRGFTFQKAKKSCHKNIP
jgi:cellulose biosynthesis protein BcsQ